MSISERIREARALAGISQTEFEQITGLRKESLSRWENGRRGLSISGLMAICKATGASADYILGLKD